MKRLWGLQKFCDCNANFLRIFSQKRRENRIIKRRNKHICRIRKKIKKQGKKKKGGKSCQPTTDTISLLIKQQVHTFIKGTAANYYSPHHYFQMATRLQTIFSPSSKT